MRLLVDVFRGVDVWLISAAVLLSVLGLLTMYSHTGDNLFFNRQIVWIGISIMALCAAMVPDYRFLRTGYTAILLYVITVCTLLLIFVFGEITLGAQQRFDFGFFAFQPSDPAKLVLIVVLAKYFAKRHELIGDFRHILVSGVYAGILFVLVFLQPDFGGAVIMGSIWFGMVFISGIKMKHIAVVLLCMTIALAGLWQFVLMDYQKTRIMSFLDPLSDIQGAGYNAYQSTVAVGSGQWYGRGVGYGTQSKLLFLPEYHTDFIFAAYAEEWGFLGVLLLFGLFGIVVWRLLYHALSGETNFERLFAIGVCAFLLTHFFIHIGINIGVLPVTGTTIPFLSYGGSHLLTEFVAIGMVLGMSRYRPVTIDAIIVEEFYENGRS